MARHCPDYARSSGGWVYFGALLDKMTEDGYTFETVALAVHALTALPFGTVDVLGLRPTDFNCLQDSRLAREWGAFRSAEPPASAGDASRTIDRHFLPIPVYYRACQGHSLSMLCIERMYVPYEWNLARFHGPLLHVTSKEMFMKSVTADGTIYIPDKEAGLCRERDYGLVRLLPTKVVGPWAMHDERHFPTWLSQRQEGEPPPHKMLSKSGSNPPKERERERERSIYGTLP